MKLILCIFIVAQSSWSFDVPPPYKSGDNSGENKLERIDRMEKYLNSMSSILKDVKSSMDKNKGSAKILEKLTKLEENQKSLKENFEQFKTNEFKRLELKVKFIDDEKVEKLIDRFNLYKSDTDRKIDVLKESIKEIEALVKTVQSPYKK
jgi:hypothetical protein